MHVMKNLYTPRYLGLCAAELETLENRHIAHSLAIYILRKMPRKPDDEC